MCCMTARPVPLPRMSIVYLLCRVLLSHKAVHRFVKKIGRFSPLGP